MDASFAAGALTSLWMGALATISPCPLGTNIAAVGIIAAGGGRPRSAIASALAYGAGRVAAHALIGMLILRGAETVTSASALLHSAPARLAGPLLIVVGTLLSGWLHIPTPRAFAAARQRFLASGGGGPLQTFFVGVVFALVPCPETAALFFGGMIPIASAAGSTALYPILFGIGTGAPVMLIGLALSLGASAAAARLNAFRRVERPLRAVACIAFIAAGIYISLTTIWGLELHAHA